MPTTMSEFENGTDPLWDNPQTDGPYDWENYEDFLGPEHNVYMSDLNMKYGYSVANEIKSCLPFMAQALNCKEEDLFILNFVFCRHMFNNNTKDHAIKSYGIDGLKIQYDIPLHKGNNGVFLGFTLFKCRNLEKNYIVFSTPSVSGERFYCTVIKKGDVFAVKRHFQKQQRKLFPLPG